MRSHEGRPPPGLRRPAPQKTPGTQQPARQVVGGGAALPGRCGFPRPRDGAVPDAAVFWPRGGAKIIAKIKENHWKTINMEVGSSWLQVGSKLP